MSIVLPAARPTAMYAMPSGPAPYQMAAPAYATVMPAAQPAMAYAAAPQPLVDPQTIQNQKEGHAKSLETQLRQGAEQLGQAHKNQVDMLHASATQQKMQYDLHMDQKVKEQELMMSQQYNQQLMQLQQAAQAQRAELEQQAARLTLEYQQQKTSHEFTQHKSQLEKQSYEQQAQLHAQMQKLGAPIGAPHPMAAYGAPSFQSVQAGYPVASYAAPPMTTHMQVMQRGSYVPPMGGAVLMR